MVRPMELPSPRECPGILGIPVGFLGALAGLALVLFGDVTPWGFVILALSGWVAFTSVIVCLAWEWDHFAP